MNQRWRNHRDSYRPAGEPIDPRRFEIAPIPDDSTAKAFVLAHHYSGTYPAARFRFGLYRSGGDLAGVAVFSHPCNDAVLTNIFTGVPALEAAELGRFVLLDDVAANGETWFLARCFELLKKIGLAGVVSFSDPTPRTLADGTQIFGGHVGTIYQAFNGRYLGRGRARRLRILPDGRTLSDRTIAKLRAGHKGWRAAASLLCGYGAQRPSADDLLSVWADRWIDRLTRVLRHRGNHRYAWGLCRSVARALPASAEFPKQIDEWRVAA